VFDDEMEYIKLHPKQRNRREISHIHVAVTSLALTPILEPPSNQETGAISEKKKQGSYATQGSVFLSLFPLPSFPSSQYINFQHVIITHRAKRQCRNRAFNADRGERGGDQDLQQ
jgi:hypothetical protein